MVLWLIISLMYDLDLQNTEVSKFMGDAMIFFIKSECSKFPICSYFFICYTPRAQTSFSIFLMNKPL